MLIPQPLVVLAKILVTLQLLHLGVPLHCTLAPADLLQPLLPQRAQIHSSIVSAPRRVDVDTVLLDFWLDSRHMTLQMQIAARSKDSNWQTTHRDPSELLHHLAN